MNATMKGQTHVICEICGQPIKADDTRVKTSGWLRSMIGDGGTAHYSCAARIANDRAYLSGDPPWDIGRYHPELARLVESGQLSTGQIIIPGVGLGQNAIYLARHGFEVVAVDISQEAIRKLNHRANSADVKIHTIIADFIIDEKKIEGSYDYVFERSFLQTLPSTLRRKYFQRVANILRPNGMYIGFIRGPRHPPATSQPYSFEKEEIVDLIERDFSRHEISKTISGQGNGIPNYWLVKAYVN
ncbi:class I SAM-dependent methyltransferase [Candidatus Thorarchaeota archaeon]|nr:MAG: class I SAM-dependent methyltransferase [Candidatus Thorarchaeota archaeon]